MTKKFLQEVREEIKEYRYNLWLSEGFTHEEANLLTNRTNIISIIEDTITTLEQAYKDGYITNKYIYQILEEEI